MAVTKSLVSAPLGTKLFIDATTDTNSDAAEDNVSGGATNVKYIEIDNTGNGSATYVKLQNGTNATPSSSVPDHVFYAAGSSKVSYVIETGIVFNTGLSYWGTSTAASGTSQTDPSVAVVSKILTG